MSVQTGFLLRPGALCYPECASDAKAPPEHLAAPEEVRTGMVNWTGVFNEFLQSRYNLDVGSPIFSETYATAGPAHRLHHRCSLTVNSADMGLRHVVTGAYCVNVKAAKKDACRLMLEWFKSREADPTAPAAPPNVPGRTGQAVEAMLGDAVLKLLLVMHRREHNPSSFPVDPGALNDWVVRRSTNTFLYHRHIDLSRRGELPEGLPPPKGHANADPTAFEAWIARVFRDTRGDLRATGETVFPALGVEPATLAVPGEDAQAEDSGGAEGAEEAEEAEKAEKAEGAECAEEAEGTKEAEKAEGAEGADSKSDERETTSEKLREENESA